VLSLLTTARASGQSLLDRWDSLERAHGVHLTAQLTLPTQFPGQVMTRLRANPPDSLAGHPIIRTTDLLGEHITSLPPADVLLFHLPAARVVVRPSGTEPKLKAYLEVVEPTAGRPLAASRAAAAARLEPLRTSVAALVADK
jgi:phosphomannomutase